MRLIDADALTTRITEEHRRWGEDYDALQILGDIEDAPTIELCEDAISREVAIEQIVNTPTTNQDKGQDYLEGSATRQNEIIDILKSVPSVAPSRPKDIDELVSDLAESVTLEDAVLTDVEAKAYAKGFKDGVESRPSGEWVDMDDMDEWYARVYKCSLCGAESMSSDFCPNCGADMKGADDESVDSN